MKMKTVFVAVSSALILSLLAACSALRPVPTPMPTQTPVVMPVTGVEYYFVTNKLLIPSTKEQTQAFALNLDGDAKNTLDNKFGDMFTLLTSAVPGIELQSTLDQSINAGQLVSLHTVKADDAQNDPSVSWSIFLGQASTSTPKFDGTDKFTLDPAAPTNLPIVGSLTNGHFAGGPGSAQVQMFVLNQMVRVNMIGLRLESDLSAKGCVNGKLGGGITVDEFRSKLIPAIADGLNLAVKTNKNTADTLLSTFDSDKNGTISTQELESHPLLMIVLSPDLDLLDASGKFNPNQDGVKDAYSVGLGFTCVPAIFTAPE